MSLNYETTTFLHWLSAAKQLFLQIDETLSTADKWELSQLNGTLHPTSDSIDFSVFNIFLIRFLSLLTINDVLIFICLLNNKRYKNYNGVQNEAEIFIQLIEIPNTLSSFLISAKLFTWTRFLCDIYDYYYKPRIDNCNIFERDLFGSGSKSMTLYIIDSTTVKELI